MARASDPALSRDVSDVRDSTDAGRDASDAGEARGAVVVHVFGRTDVGRTREHNEDAFVVADLTTGNATLQPEVRTHTVGPRGSLFMVADGMGGAAAGEIASAMAVEVVVRDMLVRWTQSTEPPTPEAFAAALRSATDHANARIHRYAGEHREYRGMGTTATVAGILGDVLYVAQVGDSRAYLVRDGAARQITKDQSLMQRLVEAGEITAEEAEVSERRNIILQALGPEASVKIDVTHQRVRRGDTLILCSDGLSGLVRGDEIARAVVAQRDLVTLCRSLIDAANAAGGPDNITVIAARFEGDGLSDAASGDDIGYQVFPLTPEDSAGHEDTQEYAARTTVPIPVMVEEDVTPTPRPPASVRRAYLLVGGLGVLLLTAWALHEFVLSR